MCGCDSWFRDCCWFFVLPVIGILGWTLVFSGVIGFVVVLGVVFWDWQGERFFFSFSGMRDVVSCGILGVGVRGCLLTGFPFRGFEGTALVYWDSILRDWIVG